MTKIDKKYWLIESVTTFASILIMVLLIQHYLIAPFRVHGQSMCNTLNFDEEGFCSIGEYEQIMISAFSYLVEEPKNGEVIVFELEEGDTKIALIKRIIGAPGDQIQLKNGEVFLKKNGEKDFYMLDEQYLNSENKHKTNSHNLENKIITVPENSYFVMGDNRRVSNDSRMCFQKISKAECDENSDLLFINKEDIRGKAWFVFWPLTNWREI